MAFDGALYSLKEFELMYTYETTAGAAILTDGGSQSGQLINLEAPPVFSMPGSEFYGPRHHTGRTARAAQAYRSFVGNIKEFTFTCLYDQTVAANFLENIMGVTVGSTPAGYEVAYNYTGPELKAGDSVSDYTGTISFGFISPESGKSWILKGCIVKALRIYATAGDDGGRLKMDVTVQTGEQITYDVDESNWVKVALKTTYRTIYELATIVQINSADMVMAGFEINLDSNLLMAGMNNTNGDPICWARGIPEFLAEIKMLVKYDANSEQFIQDSGGGEADYVVQVSNFATWANVNNTFGFSATDAFIKNNLNLSDIEGGAFFEVDMKCLAGASGNLIEIVP